MIRRGPYGPSITWSSPMTDARIVSISGDLGSRVSTPPLSHGSRSPGNTDRVTAIDGLRPVHPKGVDGATTPNTERVTQDTIASLALLASHGLAQADGEPDVAD